MIKYIATDMDGTLLGADQKISDENKRAILAAIETGINVVISTGRPYFAAKFPVKEADLELPLICMNGAQTYTFDGEILETVSIDISTVNEVARILKDNEIYFELYTNKGQFSTDSDKAKTLLADIIFSSGHYHSYEEVLEGVNKRFTNGELQFVTDYESLLNIDSIQFYKLLAFSMDIEKLNKIGDSLKEFRDLAISSSGFANMEITNINGQKGLAVERYMNKLGISMKEVMTIGDSYNDVSMLTRAGFAVAMGNAPDDVKQHAHFVTSTNIEHGFAEAVYKVIEMNKKEQE